MLPLTLLPTVESGTFLDGLEIGYSAESAGKIADPLDSAFAEILGSSNAMTTDDTLSAGDLLPTGGKTLPPLPDEDGAARMPGPEEIAASLKEQIARLMPPNGIPSGDSSDPAPAADPSFVDIKGEARTVEAMVSHAGAHTDPAAEPLPASHVQSPEVVIQTHGGSGHPVADPDTRIPLIPAPALDRTQADGSRDAPRVPASAANRLAADSPAVEPKQPLAATDEPALTLFDGRTHDSRPSSVTPNPAPAAAIPLMEDIGGESPGLPRLAISEGTVTTGSRPVPIPSQPPLAVPVQDPGWDQAVSERVVMMAANKMQTAEIRLTPAELGPLRIQVAMDDNSAQVSFTAQHAVTRDALEQALPRLREMFAESGIQLGDARVDVDTRDARERQAGQEPDGAIDPRRSADSDDGNIDRDQAEPAPIREQRGLVDTFV